MSTGVKFRLNVNFVVLLTCGDLVLPLAKYAATVRRRTICTCCGRVHALVFVHVHALVELNGSDIDAVFLTFSLELSGECHTQDD